MLCLFGSIGHAYAMVGPSSSDDKQLHDLYKKYESLYKPVQNDRAAIVLNAKKIVQSFPDSSVEYKDSMSYFAERFKGNQQLENDLIKKWEKESFDLLMLHYMCKKEGQQFKITHKGYSHWPTLIHPFDREPNQTIFDETFFADGTSSPQNQNKLRSKRNSIHPVKTISKKS